MKIIYYKDISLPEALELLEKRINENNFNENQKKMYDYLKKFSKFDADKSRKIIERLTSELNLTRDVAIQIVNINPVHEEELKILIPSEIYLSSQQYKQILSILKE